MILQKTRIKKVSKKIISFKEYDPDFCSKFGDGAEVENHIIDDTEDVLDYKSFATSKMNWNDYVWATEEPGYFTSNPDPSK